MLFEITWRLGIGVDIQHVEQEFEPCEFVDEDDKEEEGMLHFSGLRVLLPFIQIRFGEATALV
jgi:hypothetical protein